MKQNNSLTTDNNLKKGQIEIKGYIDEYNKDNKIEFTATAKAITIDWGDGTVEKFTPNNLESTFTHIYNNKVDCYTITVDTEDMIELICCSSLLTSLNMSGCSVLTRLDCSFNELTSLNVSGCTALTTLYCYDNQLTSLDLSRNNALTTLYCCYNQLTSLDVNGCDALETLICRNNPLTAEALNSIFNSIPNHTDTQKEAILNYYETIGAEMCKKDIFINKGWKEIENPYQ
jgi:hypothetical protein